MSAPLKPWEVNNMNMSNSGNILNSSINSGKISENVIQTPVGRLRMNPPLPPRPQTQNAFNYTNYNSSYGAYNRPYTSYSYSPYSSFNSYGGYGSYMGGYGSYGNYGPGYNSYGPGYGNFSPESSFIRLAEESTRPAFQTIESMVRAFQSVSMMFDSTFFAITSSFRAVLGIAENLGQLRSMFSQIWSSFALFRLIKYIYRKLLTLIGFKFNDSLNENKAVWDQAVNGNGLNGNCPKGNNWPIFLFFTIIFSAPYLISKMIPNIQENENLPENWPSNGIPVKVLYDFQATNSQELSVEKDSQILVAPKVIQEKMGLMATGWIFAARDSKNVGLVPKNYLEPPKNTNTNANTKFHQNSTFENVPENENINKNT